jgi:cytochrome P450
MNAAEIPGSFPSAPWSPAAPPPGFHDDPYPYYRALREAAPVARDKDGGLLLLRYSDVASVYRDPATFSSDKRAEFAPKYGDTPLFEHHTTSLVFNDDPYHSRVRRRLVGALTPRAIANLGASLSGYCDRLTGELADADTCNALERFAGAVPVRVIGDMFDVPDADREPLRGWSLAILGALEPAPDAETQRRGNMAVREFTLFLEDLIAARRRRPGNPESDLLTRLVAADDAHDSLSGAELVHNAIFLLNAGHETTTNLIGNALHLLAGDAALQRTLAVSPDLAGGNRHHTDDRRRQSRSRGLRAARPLRPPPPAQPPPRVWRGRPPMCGA